MQEAVVLEAAAAEERVEGVHGLVARHGLGERPVDVGRALRRQRVRVAAGRQLDVSDPHTIHTTYYQHSSHSISYAYFNVRE